MALAVRKEQLSAVRLTAGCYFSSLAFWINVNHIVISVTSTPQALRGVLPSRVPDVFRGLFSGFSPVFCVGPLCLLSRRDGESSINWRWIVLKCGLRFPRWG